VSSVSSFLQGCRSRCIGAGASLLFASAATPAMGTFSGSVALTSDYVWRGSTQTHGDPAAQTGFRYAAPSGFYASLWASSVRFAPALDANTECDATVGWSGDLADDWSLDVNVLRYVYPGTRVDLDWTEFAAAVTYAGRYWLSVGHSPTALGYDARGTYALLGAKWAWGGSARVEAGLGRYALDAATVGVDAYTHGYAGVIWTVAAPLELRATVHATDADAKTLFGDAFAGTRVEVALQAAF
jgi:uncharacterized protein (TIGR02001 family)